MFTKERKLSDISFQISFVCTSLGRIAYHTPNNDILIKDMIPFSDKTNLLNTVINDLNRIENKHFNLRYQHHLSTKFRSIAIFFLLHVDTLIAKFNLMEIFMLHMPCIFFSRYSNAVFFSEYMTVLTKQHLKTAHLYHTLSYDFSHILLLL